MPPCSHLSLWWSLGSWEEARERDGARGLWGLVVTFVLFKVKPDQQGPFLSMTRQASVPLGPQESGLF